MEEDTFYLKEMEIKLIRYNWVRNVEKGFNPLANLKYFSGVFCRQFNFFITLFWKTSNL